jgi:hypothetical protein
VLKISSNLKRHLPTEVPIPEPSQFIRGKMGDGNGRRCLVGWAREAVGADVWLQWESDMDKIAAASELANLVTCGGRNAVAWNDHIATRKEVAERWRETMQALGYKVESKPWKGAKR